MEITQTRLIAAPPRRVWEALNDPETLKACVPGCESFERTGDNAFRSTVAARIGPVSARFIGNLTLADVVAPTGYTLKFEGQGGAAGFASGEAKVSLLPAPGDATSLTYAVKAQVGGKIAQVGSRLVDGAAAKLADDFFARFAERVAPVMVAAELAVPAPVSVPAGRHWSSHLVRLIAVAAMIAIVAYLYSKGAR
jgi:hypothetical protein